MKYRVLLAAAIILMAGCSQVQPWEKGNLARTEMAWDPDPMQATLRNHIYFSKEASTGGAGTGGGGCGCN